MGVLSSITESVRDRMGAITTGEASALRESLAFTCETLNESLAGLRREDKGWTPLTGETEFGEFTTAQRIENARTCRAFAVQNPLAKNGLGLRAAFVWGTGIGVTAADEGVNEVIQAFLDEPGNRAAFTGHQAHLDLEQAIATDGGVFLALFTNPRTGEVKARTLPFEQVTEIIANPDDSSEPWFYKREWTATTRDVYNGERRTTSHKAYYPALGYRPAIRPRTIDGVEVRWDAPVHHTKDNGNPGWAHGVPDLYPVTSWLRAYTGMLTDWARLTKALSTIAYRISGKNKGDVMAARSAMQTALNAGTPGGAIATTGAEIEAMPKTDAKIDAEAGLPIARMVAAGLGLPITMLIGDPGTTGARAVAETLTQPMVLGFKNRRELWTETKRAVLNYVIDASVEAPLGALTGARRVEGGRIVIETPFERTLIIEWPEIEQVTLTETVDAVTKAREAGLIPGETAARLTLRALRVRDVDEVIDSMRDAEGNFLTSDTGELDAMLTRRLAGETL